VRGILCTLDPTSLWHAFGNGLTHRAKSRDVSTVVGAHQRVRRVVLPAGPHCLPGYLVTRRSSASLHQVYSHQEPGSKPTIAPHSDLRKEAANRRAIGSPMYTVVASTLHFAPAGRTPLDPSPVPEQNLPSQSS